MELKPTLRVRQQLALSPRLYHSLKILRLSATDLMALIQKELDENPTLEMPEPSDLASEPISSGAGMLGEQELWRDMAAANSGESPLGRRDPLRADNVASAVELAASPVSLCDHLSMQLNMLPLKEEERCAAMAIIGNLDEDGYLREPLVEIAATVDRSVEDIEAALRIVQSFDPPGIAARSLEECLIIQLEQMNSQGIATQIAEKHLPQLARGAYGDIAKELKVPVARVERAATLIRSLNPSPGSLFDSSPPAARVIPDVYVSKGAGRARVLANREILPSLHVSNFYRQIAEAAKAGASKKDSSGGVSAGGPEAGSPEAPAIADPETADYIRNKVRDASRLIHDVNQRRTTVAKVARAIADAQPDFMEKGPDYLRPLSLDDIAAKLDVHPSTISRAVLGKYMSTPHGIFEFRYFFSAGYSSCGECGQGLAATAVKKRLKKIIEAEDPRRPLSDQKLTNLLKQDDIPISRRTVAKYREEMGIPPSWDRKKKTPEAP